MQIEIKSQIASNTEIYRTLSLGGDSYRLEIRPPSASELKRGGVDAGTLVAVCLAFEPSLRLIVTALLELIKIRKEGKIVIKGATGRSVEVPADTTPEALSMYIESAKQMDIESIRLL